MKIHALLLQRLAGGGIFISLMASMLLPIDRMSDISGFSLIAVAPFTLVTNLWVAVAVPLSITDGRILDWSNDDWRYAWERMNLFPLAFVLLLLGSLRLIVGRRPSVSYLAFTAIAFLTTLHPFIMPFRDDRIYPSGLASVVFGTAAATFLLVGGLLAIARPGHVPSVDSR